MAAPSPIACQEKARLLKEFSLAVSEHHRLQSEHLGAVLRGDVFPFEDEISRAAERRENAKYAVLAHCQRHGC